MSLQGMTRRQRMAFFDDLAKIGMTVAPDGAIDVPIGVTADQAGRLFDVLVKYGFDAATFAIEDPDGKVHKVDLETLLGGKP